MFYLQINEPSICCDVVDFHCGFPQPANVLRSIYSQWILRVAWISRFTSQKRLLAKQISEGYLYIHCKK